MTADPLAPLVDEIAERIIDRIGPALVDAVQARHVPALAVSVADAATALAISPQTVRALVRDGHLVALTDVGTAMRVTVASLHAYAGHPPLPALHTVEVAS